MSAVASRKYRKTHKEEIAARRKKHYAEHREKMKKYRAEHKKEIDSRNRKYYGIHKEGIIVCSKKYYEENKEEIKVRTKKYLKENKGKIREYLEITKEKRFVANRKCRLITNYGLTIEQYNGMLAKQNGVCAICGSPPNGKNLSIDHDHNTNIIRGLLCQNCNSMLGFAHDSIECLVKAARYLAEDGAAR